MILSHDELNDLNRYFNDRLNELQVEFFIYRGKKMKMFTLTMLMTKMVNDWIKEKGENQ